MEREKYFEILTKYTKSPNLIKHGVVVEAVMKHFAHLNHEDEDYWGAIGLIHDVDYELYPEEHCKKCVELLEKENVPMEMIHSIQTHGYGICSEQKPEHVMERVLYTIDELTGLIIATALMKPSKKLEDVDLEAIKKKWKTKGFAAGVDRELIQKGALLMGQELEEIIDETLIAMKKIAKEIGL